MIQEYKTLVPYLKKYRYYYIFGSLALILASGSQLLIPQFIGTAVDIISYGEFNLTEILVPLGKMMTAAMLIVLGRLGWRFLIHGASRNIEAQIRTLLFRHLLKMSSSYFNRTSVGDLMARATNDMNAIRMASGMGLVAAVDGIFMTVTILIILFTQSPRLAVFTIIPFPLITIFILTLGSMVGKLFRGVQNSFSDVSTQAQEVLSGIGVVQAYAKEDHFIQRFDEANLKYQQKNMQLVRIWGAFMPVITFLSGLTTLLLLRFGGEQVILSQLSPGEFVATLSYLQLLVWPMMGAGWTVNLIQRGAASLQRINEVLNTKPEIVDSEHAVLVEKPIKSIQIRNLSFRYEPEGPEILSDINMEIQNGKSIGILGRTGSGKTTLIQLFCRLYNPPPNSLLVNGHDILNVSKESLRSAIGVVTQNSFLFSTSMRKNIAFGLYEHEHEQLQKAADISTITRDMADFPQGWETQIGERGISLSGGQKQRTSIARAIAVDPEILVFDDALSAVDTHTEEQILQRLFEARSGRTNIIISHRISTLSHTDYIYVMDGGKIIQTGTHEDLSATPGLYSDIVKMQKLDSEHEGTT
ncbi:ABC transporter ATP-binding protein [Spirochaeta dissipatitropha]